MATSGAPRAQALAFLKDAVRVDPEFAAAHAALSRNEGELGGFGNRQSFANSIIRLSPNTPQRRVTRWGPGPAFQRNRREQ